MQNPVRRKTFSVNHESVLGRYSKSVRFQTGSQPGLNEKTLRAHFWQIQSSDYYVLAKIRQNASLPPKSGQNGLFSEKQIVKLRQF
jgi:hypothetical protein